MEDSTSTHPLSIFIQDTVKSAVGDSILALRERELAIFSEDRDSAVAVRLGSIRTELQRIFSGRPVRAEVLQRAVEGLRQPDVPEPELAEVCAGG